MKNNLFNLKTAVLSLGLFFSTAASAATFTAVTSGNWSSSSTWGGTAPTGTVSGDNIIIGSGITVTLDMDVTFSGGLLLSNTFNVDGVVTSTTNALTMTQGALTGTGMITVKKMAFINNATSAFTGTVNAGTFWNSTSSLAFIANANVSDTLALESGVLNLGGASNLMLMTNSTIRVNSGSVSLGSGVFNTSSNHNVMYVGASKTSGLELSGTTVQNVMVNLNGSNQTLTMGNDLTVNGNMSFNGGKVDLNGKKLIVMGDLNMNASGSGTTSSTFIGSPNSDFTIMGTGALTSGLMFDAGSALHDLTVNRSGSTVKLMSDLHVGGHLNLITGTLSLENGSDMTVNSGAIIHVEGGTMSTNSGNFTGSSSYNVEYAGSGNATSGVELTGSGLNDLTINYSSPSNHATLNNNIAVNGSLNMMNGGLDLNGKNLTLNGSISQGTMNATLIGSNNSDLILNLSSASNGTLNFDQSNNNLHKLELNLANSSSSVMIGTAATINNELHFIKGHLALGTSGDLTIASNGTITGYDNNNYIITTGSGSTTTGGHLAMMVNSGANDYVTFPVGTEQNYSPAYIQQASGATSGNFMVMAANEFLVNGTSGIDESGSQSLVKRTWYIESASNMTVNMNLKLGWTSAAEVNGFNRSNAMIRHYTNSAWDMTTAASATAGANGTFEISRSGFTSLSPFGVTDNTTSVGIKQVAANTANFELYPNPAKESITIKTAGASKCELIDITGRTIATSATADAVQKLDVSKLDKGYYFIKVTDGENNTGIKRFVKE